jgi:hypothetical protein
LADLLREQPALLSERALLVIASEQRLYCLQHAEILASYSVSTSRFGLGCREGSQQTPTGWHEISGKIGAGAPLGEVFVGRVAQGWRAEINHDCATTPGADRITSRILWLAGCEPGRNCGEGIDSHDRYIYLHGTAEEGLLGTPASIGCVRMANADVIELFDWVDVGCPLLIAANWARIHPG